MKDIHDLKDAHFEFALRRDGFAVERRTLVPNACTAEHAHAFDVRALVLNGEITLTVEGIDYAYRAGDIFVMPAGHLHAETVGPEGVEYLVGRRASMHEGAMAQPETAAEARVAGIEAMAAAAIETTDQRARA
jgi:quercetin dioxygenase-like cupin family protein